MTFSVPTKNLREWADDELDAHIAECLDQLGTITTSILSDGIEILLLEKQRRVTGDLLGSSRTIETLTKDIAKLTKRLVWLTVALCILTVALTVLTAALVHHGG